MAHWHLSHRGADERGRRSQHLNTPTSTHLQTTSRSIAACPAVNYHQLFVSRGKSSRSNRGFAEMGLQTEMDFHGSPTGRQTHRIQCSSPVLVSPCTPLTPASCWNVPRQAFPHSSVSFFISVSFSLWDLLMLATNRAALQWVIKKEMGFTVLPPFSPEIMCV